MIDDETKRTIGDKLKSNEFDMALILDCLSGDELIETIVIIFRQDERSIINVLLYSLSFFRKFEAVQWEALVLLLLIRVPHLLYKFEGFIEIFCGYDIEFLRRIGIPEDDISRLAIIQSDPDNPYNLDLDPQTLSTHSQRFRAQKMESIEEANADLEVLNSLFKTR